MLLVQVFESEIKKKKRVSVNSSERMKSFLHLLDTLNQETGSSSHQNASSLNLDSIDIHDDQINSQIHVPEVDPLTKAPLENPVKNIICGHIYGKISVQRSLEINDKLR